MTRGEVWWTDVPGTGRRPCLVLTRDSYLPYLGSVVIAQVTTTIRGAPTEVVIDEGDGMPQRSAVSLDNVTTVSKRDFRERITMLNSARMDEVCAALRYAVAC